jgi:hypothetical protein
MLSFKKYLKEAIKIDLDSELEKLSRNKNKSTKKAVFDTIFKKGACGGKSCSRRQPGETGWDYRDDYNDLMGNKENYKPLKLHPEVSPGAKCYYVEKNNGEFILLEVPFNTKSLIIPADIKNYNFYIEKNKNKIFLQINKDLTNQIKYVKHTKFNNKLIIEYQVIAGN